MQDIGPHVSQYIEGQFPELYREEGPALVRFVTAYFEWLESEGQAVYHARRLPSYIDIDSTLDDFLTHFKVKYLPNIQFTTASSRRLFVKNALNFHRSKGSKRSVELFFKLIYGVAANIYYPGDDLFKTSDGEWVTPTYVEVTPTPRLKEFIGQTITGITSYATAFVESYVRVRIKGKYVDVLYLSDTRGTFLGGEVLRLTSVHPDDPKVMGSVSQFDVVSGGAGFNLGERVGTISENGQFATAIVSNVSNIVGAANVELIDGGYGYNSDSEIVISDKTLVVRGLSNTGFDKLDIIQELYANGSVASNADVIGTSRDHILSASILSGDVSVGQRLAQGDVFGTVVKIEQIGVNVEVSLENVLNGVFQTSIAANTTTGAINVISYSTLIGIANVSGPGSYSIGNKIYSVKTGLQGTITAASQTSNDLTFSLSSNNRFTNRRSANVCLDYIKPYLDIGLNASSFGFPKNPSGNGSVDVISSMIRSETRTYGTISNNSIVGLYNGSGYTRQPFILVKEQIPYDLRYTHNVIEIDLQQSSFITGEKLITGTRAANGAVFVSIDPVPGIVISSKDNIEVVARRMSLNHFFSEHSPTDYMLIGETSGATARMRKVNVPIVYNTDYLGLNADIRAEVFTSKGLVTGLKMNTSGYAYANGETVTFFSIQDPNKTGLAKVFTKTHGIGSGYYLVSGGETSSNKRLQDNNYYQEYSYEIRSPIESDTYKKMFDEVLHVAGTKGFSAYLSVVSADLSSTVISQPIIQD